MNEALGMIEVKGLVAAIDVADVMAKVAAIKLERSVRTRGFGWTSICISGDVAAVTAAIQAGKEIANQNHWLVSVNVIPRPAAGLDVLFQEKKPKAAVISKDEIPEKGNFKATDETPAEAKVTTKTAETAKIQQLSPEATKKQTDSVKTASVKKISTVDKKKPATQRSKTTRTNKSN